MKTTRLIALVTLLAALAWAGFGGTLAYGATKKPVPKPVPKPVVKCGKKVADYDYGTDLAFQVLTATTSSCRTGARWVITLHGGSWINGSRTSVQNAVNAFYDHGWQVFNVEYRRGTTITFGEQKADVVAAYDWITAHATQFGINPAWGSAYGFSAGGNLAAWLGNLRPLSAVVTVAGVLEPQRVADDDNGLRPTTEPTTQQMHDLHEREITMMGCDYRATTQYCAQDWNDFSPETGITAHSAPMFMVQGESDPDIPIPTPRSYGYWLGKAGVRHTVAYVPGYAHTSAALLSSPLLRYTVQHWMVARYGSST